MVVEFDTKTMTFTVTKTQIWAQTQTPFSPSRFFFENFQSFLFTEKVQ